MVLMCCARTNQETTSPSHFSFVIRNMEEIMYKNHEQIPTPTTNTINEMLPYTEHNAFPSSETIYFEIHLKNKKTLLLQYTEIGRHQDTTEYNIRLTTVY